MQPLKVEKDIGEMKNPAIRVLLKFLLFIVMALAGGYYASINARLVDLKMNAENCEARMMMKDKKIDSLTNVAITKSEVDNVRLKRWVTRQDSIAEVLQTKLKKRR